MAARADVATAKAESSVASAVQQRRVSLLALDNGRARRERGEIRPIGSPSGAACGEGIQAGIDSQDILGRTLQQRAVRGDAQRVDMQYA
jgi:hypothetical protein